MADFRLLDARTQEAMQPAPYHEWVFPDGERWAQFFRTDAGYLLRFPELADFGISGVALSVTCYPAPEVTAGTCEHIYLNQVLPLVLSKQGKLVFHASAVEVAGVAAAFLAESGRGKSTLAASFATGGYRFLTDDGLVVEAGVGGFLALPSHPSIRLCEDSQRALVAATAATAPPVQYTDKVRFLAGEGITFCPQPRPLKRAYFLGDGQAAAVTFERMSAPEAMMEWVKNSFLLDPKEPSLLASHFGKVAELANRIRCYRLDFPRRFEELPRLRQAIVEHLEEEGVAA
jgi:hypothetical protein